MILSTLQTALITLAICQAVILLLPPLIVKTQNKKILGRATAKNNPVFIFIDPEQRFYDPVLAQEVFECESRKRFDRLIRWYISKDFKQRLEATGQEIEVQLVTAQDPRIDIYSYRRKQARRLVNNYSQFKGWSEDDVYNLMVECSDEANMWIEKNW